MKMQTPPEPNKTALAPGRYLIVDRQLPFRSETLFGGASEIRIEHRGERYSLRITRNGKLILTK